MKDSRTTDPGVDNLQEWSHDQLVRYARQLARESGEAIALLTAERDRLRAALETIASGHTVAFPAHIAREALAGEDRPKDRPEVNAAYPIGYSEPHAKRSETAETAPNADKVAVSRLSDETTPAPTTPKPRRDTFEPGAWGDEMYDRAMRTWSALNGN